VTNSNFVRVVLDTNVLISAVLKPNGLEAAVVDGILAGTLEAHVTPQVWAEYEEVFTRRKFAVLRSESTRILAALDRVVHRTEATTIATSAKDEDDNRFLECADAARANFLVTGNLRHYPSEYGCTRILNARGLFDALGTPQQQTETNRHPQAPCRGGDCIMDDDQEKCAHPSCHCLAKEDSKYCGTYCEGEGETADIVCNCGHAGCSDA